MRCFFTLFFFLRRGEELPQLRTKGWEVGSSELGPGRWRGSWKWLGKAGCLGLKAGKGIPGHEANCLLYRVNGGPGDWQGP